MNFGFPRLRRILLSVLPTSSALDAFVFDHYRTAHKQLSSAMNSDEKITLLFQHCDDPQHIFARLLESHPEEVQRFLGKLGADGMHVASGRGVGWNTVPRHERSRHVDILGAALKLDRSVQQMHIEEACRGSENCVFLLVGHHSQNVSLFVYRLYKLLEEHYNHSIVEIPIKHEGNLAQCGAELETLLLTKLNEHLGHPPDDVATLLAAERRPLLLVIGRRPIRTLESRPREALREFLCDRLPERIVRSRRRSLRLLLAVDYDTDASFVEQATVWAQSCARQAGMRYCRLPELVLPTWGEVEGYLRMLESGVSEELITRFREIYRELELREQTSGFRELADRIDEFLES